MELDKIISAWEHCISDEGDCDDCPYNNDFNGCMLILKKDTIDLLKSFKERQRDEGEWKMTELLDEKNGLFNCGCCWKCWQAPRHTDLYKAGFKYCPNCGAKMKGR